MATALYSNPPLADFILSEASGQRSRDNILVVQTGDAVPSGATLKLASAGVASVAVGAGATGNFTFGAITVGTAAKGGIYTVEFTTATAYKVTDPDGTAVDTGATGTAFSAGGLGFTITAGTTAAVAGDTATLDVTLVSNVFTPCATTGASASAILYTALPAATGIFPAVGFTADCEVKRSALVNCTSVAEIALAKSGIKVRGKAGLPGIATPAL